MLRLLLLLLLKKRGVRLEGSLLVRSNEYRPLCIACIMASSLCRLLDETVGYVA